MEVKLIGSEKQIAWATKIKEQFLQDFYKIKDDRHMIEVMNASFVYTVEQYEEALNNITSAAYLIDNRNAHFLKIAEDELLKREDYVCTSSDNAKVNEWKTKFITAFNRFTANKLRNERLLKETDTMTYEEKRNEMRALLLSQDDNWWFENEKMLMFYEEHNALYRIYTLANKLYEEKHNK